MLCLGSYIGVGDQVIMLLGLSARPGQIDPAASEKTVWQRLAIGDIIPLAIATQHVGQH